MASMAERKLSQALREVLSEEPIGARLPDSARFQEAMTALAWFVPAVLGELHVEWKGEAIDEVASVEARKRGEGDVEIFAVCGFLSDRRWAPMHLRLQVTLISDEVAWLECWIGERTWDESTHSPRELRNRLSRVARGLNHVEWMYRVAFGERRG